MYTLDIPAQTLFEKVVKMEVKPQYELFATECNVVVVLRDENDKLVRSYDLVMDKETLQSWNVDDQFVVDWCVKQLDIKM